jgi:hypothetical protein
VDVGCFVKTGAHFSAPSFVSFYYLPSETRIYREDGQIQSVDYSNPLQERNQGVRRPL